MLLACIFTTSNKFHDNLQGLVSWPQVEWYQNPGEDLFFPWLVVDPDKEDDDVLQLPALHAFDTNSLGRADTGVNVLKLVEVLF